MFDVLCFGHRDIKSHAGQFHLLVTGKGSLLVVAPFGNEEGNITQVRHQGLPEHYRGAVVGEHDAAAFTRHLEYYDGK